MDPDPSGKFVTVPDPEMDPTNKKILRYLVLSSQKSRNILCSLGRENLTLSKTSFNPFGTIHKRYPENFSEDSQIIHALTSCSIIIHYFFLTQGLESLKMYLENERNSKELDIIVFFARIFSSPLFWPRVRRCFFQNREFKDLVTNLSYACIGSFIPKHIKKRNLLKFFAKSVWIKYYY